MNILDWLYAGNVIKNFGIVHEKLFGIGKMRHTALLAERYDRYFFVLKSTAVAILAASAKYQVYTLEDARKIRNYISESQRLAGSLALQEAYRLEDEGKRGIFPNILDRMFVGRTIKDFGTLDEKSFGIGKIRHSAILTESGGQYFFVIKFSGYAIFGASVSYDSYPLERAAKICEFISEGEQIARSMPPSTKNISAIAIRNMLVAMLIAVLLILIAPTGVIATFIAFGVQLNQYMEFRDHPKVDPATKRNLLFILLGTVGIGLVKIIVMTILGINDIVAN